VSPAQRGSLEQTGLPEILRPIVKASRSGVLRCNRGRVARTVYVSEGRLIFATSTDPDDRLGERLLKKGLISYRALEDSVQGLRSGKRQGTLLVENGAIRSRDLVEGVTAQVQEVIYSLFRWCDGEYEFAEGDLPSREVIVLRMSTADLIMEGVRRVTRWSQVRRGVGAIEQRYTLAPEAAGLMSAVTLQREELGIVATLDGVATVEEICRAARQPDFAVCRTLWGLWGVGILDRIPQDREQAAPREETDPHVERLRGASVAKEIDRFNELHHFLFELVSYELRDQAGSFFERAFQRASHEHASLFEGVAVDGGGELDVFALRRNIATQELSGYLRGLDRLLRIETDLAREVLGERKAAIIEDGLLALKQRQLEASEPRR
jgi:hypothetical protein